MSAWNHRQLPHPLLAPWTDDYGDRKFSASVPHAVEGNGKSINFTIKYHLTCGALSDLISKGDAHYVAVLTCPSTSQRIALRTPFDDENVHVLKSGDYSDELLLSPYVVASRHVGGFISDEMADEFRTFKPGGFDLPRGAILAVGEDTRISLDDSGSPESVIDLVSVRTMDHGMFNVDLEESRIKIYVSPVDKQRIDALRDRGVSSKEGALLFPSVYLHAVTEALRKMSDHSEDKSWVRSMKKSLDNRNITADDEELKNDALKYAQRLMDRPIGMLLRAFVNREEE